MQWWNGKNIELKTNESWSGVFKDSKQNKKKIDFLCISVDELLHNLHRKNNNFFCSIINFSKETKNDEYYPRSEEYIVIIIEHTEVWDWHRFCIETCTWLCHRMSNKIPNFLYFQCGLEQKEKLSSKL